MKQPVSIVVFDLGGVLVDWNPRYLYRDLFGGDTAAMEDFLTTICTPAWNHEQDAGRSFAEAAAVLKKQHPDKADLIDAWFPGFNKMMSGAIGGTVDILAQLRAAKMPLYALTNWSAETFPVARKRFDFLAWFKGIVVSGEEKIAKPDPRLFDILIERYAIKPEQTIYIDDVAANIEAARALKFNVIHFTGPESLAASLRCYDLLSPDFLSDLKVPA